MAIIKQHNRKPRKTTEIDATGKVLGRLASDIAKILQGKNRVDFIPYLDTGDTVKVSNASHIKITGKLNQKFYYRHSFYPGGLKSESQEKVLAVHGVGELLRRAVKNMLPKNKLQDERIKRLIIVK